MTFGEQASSLRANGPAGPMPRNADARWSRSQASLPLRPVVENAEHGERHRGDAGLDGWPRHRCKQGRVIARRLKPCPIARRRDALRLIDTDIEKHRWHARVDILR